MTLLREISNNKFNVFPLCFAQVWCHCQNTKQLHRGWVGQSYPSLGKRDSLEASCSCKSRALSNWYGKCAVREEEIFLLGYPYLLLISCWVYPYRSPT